MPPLEGETIHSKKVETFNDLVAISMLPEEVQKNVAKYKKSAIVEPSTDAAKSRYFTVTMGLLPGWAKIEKQLNDSGAVAKASGGVGILFVNSTLNPEPHTEFVLTHEATELALQDDIDLCVMILKKLTLFEPANQVPSGARPLYPHYIALVHEYIQAKKAGKLTMHHESYLGKDRHPSGSAFRSAVYDLISSLRNE